MSETSKQEPSPPPSGTRDQLAPAPGLTWNLPRIVRSGVSFQTLIGTYQEGARSEPPAPVLPELSLHYWHLKPGDRDDQHPHRQAEVYYVLGGAGTLTVGGKPHALVEGDLIYVPRDTPHTFHDFDRGDGLRLLIFFAPNYTGRG